MSIYSIIENNVVVNNIVSNTSPSVKDNQIAVETTNSRVSKGDLYNPDLGTFSTPLKSAFSLEHTTIIDEENKLISPDLTSLKIRLCSNYIIDPLTIEDFNSENCTIDSLTLDKPTHYLLEITIDENYISSNSNEPITVSLNKDITTSSNGTSCRPRTLSFYYVELPEGELIPDPDA